MSDNEKLQDIFYHLFSYNHLRLLFCYLIYFQSGKNYHFWPRVGKKIMIFSFNSGKISYFFHNFLENSKRISVSTLDMKGGTSVSTRPMATKFGKHVHFWTIWSRRNASWVKINLNATDNVAIGRSRDFEKTL